MPNHVRNILKFSKLTEEERDFILETLTSETIKDGIFPLNRGFDLDKVIPEPREKSDCPEDCLVNKDSHVSEYPGRPWFDWYKWHNKYWGTKWNAYDHRIKVGKSTITFIFSTAWATPLPVYEMLARLYPVVQFEVKYADEDYGVNCGHILYYPKHDHIYHYQAYHLKDPVAFARRVWKY